MQSSVVPAAARVLGMVAGTVAADKMNFSISLNELKQTLMPINEHLALRNFLVGYQMSIADVLLVTVLSKCFELVLDKKCRDN